MSSLLMHEQATAPSSPSTGKRLIYPKSDGWYGKDSAGTEIKISGATNINDLVDVNITTPAERDFLMYDTTTSKWINTKTTGSVFGCSAEMTSSSDSPPDSNSTTTYSTYETLSNVPCEANKKFRIGAGIIWGMSVTNQDFEAILTVEPAGGTETTLGGFNVRATNSGSDQKHISYLPFEFIPTSGVAHTIRMKYRPEGGIAYVHYGVLEMWRFEL